MIFITHHNSSEVLQPSKQALYFPAPFVAPQFSAVLRFRLLAIGFVRCNQLGPKLRQLFIQRVTVICLVANHLFRSLIGETFANNFFDKFDFMRLSTLRVDGDRKTRNVCHCHELRALAPLGFSNLEAPFFATMNVPSIKVSDKSKPPRECKSSANISNTLRKVPSLTQVWKRRWQVWYGGKRDGKSLHRAPERNIHKTPFITSRASRGGLPRVWTTSLSSNNGCIKDHCSSVNSSLLAIGEVYQTIFEMASRNH